MGTLVSFILGALFASIIIAIFLRLAAKWIIKEDVAFGGAYLTSFIICSIYAIGKIILNFGFGYIGDLMMLPIGLLIQAFFVKLRLKIAFGKACLISLVMTALAIGLGTAIWAIIYFGMAASQ